MPFERLLGGLAFLSLIPLIILYLRRPKPLDQVIPSLMFFMKERGTTRFHSFLQQFLHNLLFLLQLIILCVLAFSLMGLFVTTTAEKSGRSVLVIDASASMQTTHDGTTRFAKALEEASDRAEGKVSIVLATNVPRVILEDGGAEEARNLLKTLAATDTSTNLGDAILVAKDLLQGGGDILVFSDFLATEGLDPLVAKQLVSSGTNVEFINLGGTARNAGIVALSPGKATITAVIKNFNDYPVDAKVRISSSGTTKDEATLNILPNSIEEFSFDTLFGRSQIEIISEDDFKADNTAYLSIPSTSRARVLLITNAEKSPLRAALLAQRSITLDVAIPPVVNSFDYDVIILHQFNPKLMLPGYYKEIDARVTNGSNLIISAQPDLASAGIPFLPVTLIGIANTSQNVVNITNFVTDGLDFGLNEQQLLARPSTDSATLVSAQGHPVITYSSRGAGTITYYGLLDDFSTFKNSPAYPQFWSRLMSFLTKTESLSAFHFETGRIEAIAEQTVRTPEGTIKTDRVLFDKAGFYTYEGKEVAANLLNARESAVSTNATAFEHETRKLAITPTPLQERKYFEEYFALLAAILILLELLYVKIRGDA